MTSSAALLKQLDDALKSRRIGDGIRLLNDAGANWMCPAAGPVGAAIVLRAAQWLDVGYRDQKWVAGLLAQFPPALRARMPVRDYLYLRLAEAFYCLVTENADGAIELLDFVLKAESELGDEHLMVLAHF